MLLKSRNGVLGLSIVALILGCLTGTVSANVIGFDFGSTFFKITLVQPGNPFQIVENTTSKRKTHSQFTITNEQRLFGADSFIGTSRFYKTTFSDVASLFAMPYSEETVAELASQFILNDFTEDERGLVATQTFSIDKKELKEDEDAKATYFSEELAATILAYGKQLAEKQAAGTGRVNDAVITVPSYYDQEKRRMLLDAADLAGLKVIQLVHENTAAALMYGIDRLDTEEDVNVLIYNMGGRDTEVSVVRFSAVTDAKNKTYEYVEILGEGYDETLGGKEFDHVLVNILADKFNSMKERKDKSDIRSNPRAMKRLYKEAVSIKDILSANKLVNIKVPELADYVTLAFELRREDYEQACEHLFNRVRSPITQALDEAGLTADQVHQIEILGGGIRVPKVQSILKETMGGDKELNVHLNGDEAMSFGSAFIASNSSSSFKVRKVYLTQHPKYDIRVRISPLDTEFAEIKKQEALAGAGSEDSEYEGEDNAPITYEKETLLYKRTDYLGQKKTIHVNYDVDMLIEATAIYPDGSEEELVSWELNEMTKIMEKDVMQKETTTRPKVSLSFELSRSNLFLLNSAKVNVEETVLEEIIPEKPEKNDDEDEKDDSDEEKSEEGDVENSDEEATEVNDAETESAEAESEVEVEKEYKEVVVPHTYTMDQIAENLPNMRLLTDDQKKAARKRLSALDKRDNDKEMSDEAKNSYESLIYALRGWLREDENEKYVLEADREALLQKLDDGEDWLYDEGAQLPYTKYQERSYELTVEQTKFNKRKNEHMAREKQVPKLREALDETRTRAHMIREAMPWVTEQDQQDLLEKVEETRDWLDKKMEEQDKLELTEDPTFTMDQFEKQMDKLNKLAKKIYGKKKPKEKKKPKKEEAEDADEAAGEETTDAGADNNGEEAERSEDSTQQQEETNFEGATDEL